MELLLDLFQGLNQFLNGSSITLFGEYTFTFFEVLKFSVGFAFVLVIVWILFHITEW